MPGKLSPEEIVTLITLSEKGQPNAQIARTLGVTEGAVRYHLRRAEAGAADGRRGKPRKADPLAQVIDHWLRDGRPEPAGEAPPPAVNVRALYDHLVAERQGVHPVVRDDDGRNSQPTQEMSKLRPHMISRCRIKGR